MEERSINIGLVGITGYTGMELARLLELRESLKALKGPLANVPEFRRKVQEMVSDDKARAALLNELNIDEK